MTKKAVHAMNPKCKTNGSTDADKYPGHASADSDSMGTVATSPLITFFLLLRFKCSVAGVSSLTVTKVRYKAWLNIQSHKITYACWYAVQNNGWSN